MEERTIHGRGNLSPLVGLVVFVALSTTASAAKAQVGVIFEVGKYDNDYPAVCPDTSGEGRCCDDCTNLCNANCGYYDHAGAIKNRMEAFGYSTVYRYQNTGVDDKDFYTRTTTYDWARDYNSPYGFDSADVAWYGGHGSMRCTKTWDDPNFSHVSTWAQHNQGYNASKFTMGEYHSGHGGENNTCFPRSTHPTDSDLFIMLGGGYTPVSPDQQGDVKAALLWGCRQGYYWVWHGGGFDSVRTGTMGMWNAWHSNSQVGDSWVSDLYTYGNLAMRFGGAGEYWVDMTRYHASEPLKHDHCLSSVIWGTTQADAVSRFENAKLAGVNNLPSVTNPTVSGYFYYAGCSPFPYPTTSDPDRVAGLDLPGTRGTGLTWTFKNGA